MPWRDSIICRLDNHHISSYSPSKYTPRIRRAQRVRKNRWEFAQCRPRFCTCLAFCRKRKSQIVNMKMWIPLWTLFAVFRVNVHRAVCIHLIPVGSSQGAQNATRWYTWALKTLAFRAYSSDRTIKKKYYEMFCHVLVKFYGVCPIPIPVVVSHRIAAAIFWAVAPHSCAASYVPFILPIYSCDINTNFTD